MEANLSWLEDPEIFRVNRLDAHSDHKYFDTMESLKEGEMSLLHCLNGTWKFAWSRNASERPADFYKEDFDLSGFSTIEVPGHMELQGYDKIHYINTMYPWEGHAELRPPHIDWEHNPVGSYVTEFNLPRTWKGKRVCISFQGVEEAFYVWLNGQFVGYSEDSFTPSDFDLTPYIRAHGNRLCVEVYKRSSAAWIEDQDFFRFSGIFRDVYLYAKPEYHVEDLWLKAGLDEDLETGTLGVEVKLSKQIGTDTRMIKNIGEENLILYFQIKDKAGTTVMSQILEEVQVKEDEFGTSLSLGEYKLPSVTPWSNKNPYLYDFVIFVKDRNGALIEVIRNSLGFRRFEIVDKVMYLNGERIIINGVNRHEWNPRRGRSVTKADMLRDIEIMKKNNINAVRTCHYPNQSLWYQLCDKNGIYVMDEANLESHGSWQKMGKCEPSWNVPGSLPEWKECVVDRAVSMVERDKNHPSILWWSCGNESYAGEDILAMSQYYHKKDPSRIVHYEGVFWNREFNQISDVESRMYASPEEVERYLTEDGEKPYLLCEYMHDMGNSLGGMESYIKLLDKYSQYQGGFIWDYIDQALYVKDATGQEVLAYGGDFCDRPSDYNFSANGIVFADRTEKPAMQEVRYWYSRKEKREAMALANETDREESNLSWEDEDEAQEAAFEVLHGDVNLGVRGKDFHVIFSYQEAGPVSIVYQGKEWLYRAPRPAFWRASTENDRGNGFASKSAVWMGADMFISCTGYEVKEEENQVTISYEFLTRTVPETKVTVDYTVNGLGEIKVHVHYFGKEGLPELPEFGLRFLVPEVAEKVVWQGLSGETYPDRKKGGQFGVHEDSVTISDYLVPQECKNHADTDWMQLWSGGKGIEMEKLGETFHFSAIPYTPQELENAYHKEELPAARRTVVSILGAMRGVGGIDSWGADVEAPYRVGAEKDLEYSFVIRSCM